MISRFFLFKKPSETFFVSPVQAFDSILQLEVSDIKLELDATPPITIELIFDKRMIKVNFTHNDLFAVDTDLSEALSSLNITSLDITNIVMTINSGRDFTSSQLTKSIADSTLSLNTDTNKLSIALTSSDYLLIESNKNYSIYFKLFWGTNSNKTFKANTIFIEPQQVP